MESLPRRAARVSRGDRLFFPRSNYSQVRALSWDSTRVLGQEDCRPKANSPMALLKRGLNSNHHKMASAGLTVV